MAKKERNRRSARKARQLEREEREAAQIATDSDEVSEPKQVAKTQAKAPAKKSGKPGFFGRVKNYFHAVGSEMRRVVWPSGGELKDYSVGVIAMLIVFGISIWVIDNVIVVGLTALASLRG